MLHTKKAVTLGGPETNGHIWAVCYDDDNLYIDFFHGHSDGAGVYSLIATLLYYYFDEEYIPGIKTLDSSVSEAETRDPVDDLPLVDLNKLDLPVSPKALNVMEVSGLKHASGKGLILKLMIPEEPFLQFTKSNDGTPGVLISVLMARAIERIHPRHDEPLISSYVVNTRPMLGQTTPSTIAQAGSSSTMTTRSVGLHWIGSALSTAGRYSCRLMTMRSCRGWRLQAQWRR